MSTLKFLRIVAFIFMGLIALSSCRARTPWVQVSNISFQRVSYDENARVIWFAEDPGNAVYRLARPNDDLSYGNVEKIATPNDSHINNICASNGFWISSFIYSEQPPPSTPTLFHSDSPVPSTIYKYIYITKSWQKVGVFDKFVATCKSLKDGGVVSWSQNKIMRFNSTDTQPEYVNIKINWRISYVTDDLDGNLWISTANGEIYRQAKGGWSLVDTLPAKSYPSLFIDKSGNLWVAAGNKYIYKYPASSATPSRQKILEAPLGFSQDFFQDNNGAIWVVTDNKLLEQKEGGFQEVARPPYSGLLNFGFFDSKTNTLFVSTEEGVFSLDLDKLP